MATVCIPLTHGKVAVIDEGDYPLISRYHWHAVKPGKSAKWYAAASVRRGTTVVKVWMHKLLAGVTTGEVDHRDGDSLNNCRSNLRAATHRQNVHNTGLNRLNTSGYKGVHLYKPTGRWQARIRYEGERISLGFFDSAAEAAHAYDTAALELFGEFAWLNFPQDIH
jgi:hypothetical protein